MPEFAEIHPVRSPGSADLLGPDVPLSWWVRSIVIAGGLLFAAGALIALLHPSMLVSPQDQINGAVRIYAGYLCSRNLALASLLFAALAMRARRMLQSLLLLAGLIQVFDAAIDCLERRWPIVPGIVILAVFFFLAAAAISGFSFSKKEASIG